MHNHSGINNKMSALSAELTTCKLCFQFSLMLRYPLLRLFGSNSTENYNGKPGERKEKKRKVLQHVVCFGPLCSMGVIVYLLWIPLFYSIQRIPHCQSKLVPRFSVFSIPIFSLSLP